MRGIFTHTIINKRLAATRYFEILNCYESLHLCDRIAAYTNVLADVEKSVEGVEIVKVSFDANKADLDRF